jgi:hypothetical protein
VLIGPIVLLAAQLTVGVAQIVIIIHLRKQRAGLAGTIELPDNDGVAFREAREEPPSEVKPSTSGGPHRQRPNSTATSPPDEADRIAAVLVAERRAHRDGDLSAFIAAALWAAAWGLSAVVKYRSVPDRDGKARMEPLPISDFQIGTGAARLIRRQPGSWQADILLTWSESGKLVSARTMPHDTRDRLTDLTKLLTGLGHEVDPVDGGHALSQALGKAADQLGGLHLLTSGATWFPTGIEKMAAQQAVDDGPAGG